MQRKRGGKRTKSWGVEEKYNR